LRGVCCWFFGGFWKVLKLKVMLLGLRHL
jgi:hypothetical protein